MSDVPRPLDLEAIEMRVARAAERAIRGDPWDLDQDEQDRAALLAEVKRLREALEAAVMTTECMSIFPPDYPLEHLRGRELEWHRLAMLALGRETA